MHVIILVDSSFKIHTKICSMTCKQVLVRNVDNHVLFNDFDVVWLFISVSNISQIKTTKI